MEVVPFAEREAFNGRRVRVLTRDEVYDLRGSYQKASVTIEAYKGALGKEGVIVPAKRLPWADANQYDYGTLPVVLDGAQDTLDRDDETGATITRPRRTYCGVGMLVLLD